jgi:hypothetical protein
MLAKSGVDEMKGEICFSQQGLKSRLKHEFEMGKQSQHVRTINLFNTLRNGRFQFNDEVKMVIDMLKNEMTRELMKDG